VDQDMKYINLYYFRKVGEVMLNKFKKICRKNKMIFAISRVIYYPIKMVVLHPLKKKLLKDAYLELRNRTKKNIFYFGVPVHKNLGDMAQMYCTKKWCNENFPEYMLLSFKTYPTYDKKFQNKLKTTILDNDIIVFQSGYCTTDEHLDHKMHRIIVKLFPNNPIIILPQTVLFHKEIELKKTVSIYNTHSKLLFIARDNISYKTALEAFVNIKVLCYPDIVTSLIGQMNFQHDRNGVLLCMRNDYEQLYLESEINETKSILSKSTSLIDKIDTTINISYDYLLEHLEDVLMETFNKFSSYKVIITDRYHGTIFSLIANTPVIVLATTDHKVSSGVDWFSDIYNGSIYLAKSPKEAAKKACELINTDHKVNNVEYFNTNYYKKLRAIIEEL
jgi:exopolysaccharide biosynthesis predicted pyruvyltransferase EpsI